MEIIQTIKNLENLIEGLQEIESNHDLNFQEGQELACQITRAIHSANDDLEDLQDRASKLAEAADSIIALLDQHDDYELSELYATAEEIKQAIESN